MNLSPKDPNVIRAAQKGLIPADALPAANRSREKPELLAPAFTAPNVWTVPVETRSEANGRDWRARSNRTQAARRAVSRTLGPHLNYLAAFARHYHAGGTLRVILTRLGGPKLDSSNLPTALKATEDALALMLGADDGDPRWKLEPKQEPGPGPVGVRIELCRLDAR